MAHAATIEQSTMDDLKDIFHLYDLATAYQKTHISNGWPSFKEEMVVQEINKGYQYKFVADGQTACVFAIALHDPDIWFEKDEDPALYIHRIATHPDYRGQHFVKQIVEWATDFAVANKLQFIRMDTTAGNPKLIAYYQSCGFDYLGDVKLGLSENLPAHYQNASMSLFEIKVNL
ncbi:GNAT family N-acetyltransferase [Sphingobacterium hungaricum]|uniref:GNAT family N-acetyltransferase n=1 Tax=Sphingobacterium hungaricum TaxID=2082723 RepID=A0A928V208_9SPHI|nr:GNAT family N-acetyltransferase [Sphingobacterium hungaricum]MBE8715194.1 GNAT family N-acetyltransferase [Sphingobacterium hungaricum]